MKKKTSVSLDRDLLAVADDFSRLADLSRSELLERALRDFLVRAKREERDRKDRGLLDGQAEHYQGVMEDVLDYQAGDP